MRACSRKKRLPVLGVQHWLDALFKEIPMFRLHRLTVASSLFPFFLKDSGLQQQLCTEVVAIFFKLYGRSSDLRA